MVKHHGKDSCFCYFDSFGCGTRTKFLIDLRTKFWSVSFCSEDELKTDTLFHAGYSTSNRSDVSIHVPSDKEDTLKSYFMETEHSLATPASTPEEVINYPSTTVSSLLSSKSPRFGNLLPEGKLISVRGDVVSVHSSWHPGHESVDDRHRSRIFHGDSDTISIHAIMENHTVSSFTLFIAFY